MEVKVAGVLSVRVTVAAPDCDDTVGVAVSCGGRCCGCNCPLGDSSAEAYANSAGERRPSPS